MSTVAEKTVKGGSWLLEESAEAFTPEQLTEEHRLIGQTAEEFVTSEVYPVLERLEQKEWTLARALLKRCGELGLLATDVAEEYGGVALDKVTSVVVGEAIGKSASFAATFGAQTGLAITPIMCFGTPAQKQKYLPALVTGEIVGAYALSESGSGSDALGAKARAVRQPDGSFLLNGEKMWITNGGFADLFIVFAKVDGEQFTAFIVERSFPGVSTGKEEHKMGLHGSSTTPLILQDAKVPAENLLGEIGKGHKVAFNILNYGRFKLGAMCSGGAQAVVGEASRYAAQRKQFGQPIASFGAIKHKLGEMVVREYAVESMLYRTAGLIDAMIAGGTEDHEQRVLLALEEFAIESSILKVASSEMLDFVLDENVQIHGGNGFVRDYPAERHYRDARVNRIFEGTNEINRLLIPGMLMRRALKGGLPLIPAALKLQDELLSPSAAELPGDGPFEAERRADRRDEEGRAHGARHRDAEVRREGRRRAGDPELDRGHPDGGLRGGERSASGGAGLRRLQRGPARRRRARGGERRRDSGRWGGTPGAGGDGRRRHAAHASRGAAARVESHTGQHGCAAPANRGRCPSEKCVSVLRTVVLDSEFWIL